eukprot:10209233-Lingulodinium_polyedra.AAC.1
MRAQGAFSHFGSAQPGQYASYRPAMKRGMTVLFYKKGYGKGSSKVRLSDQLSVIKHPETGTEYHWTPEETLDR